MKLEHTSDFSSAYEGEGAAIATKMRNQTGGGVSLNKEFLLQKFLDGDKDYDNNLFNMMYDSQTKKLDPRYVEALLSRTNHKKVEYPEIIWRNFKEGTNPSNLDLHLYQEHFFKCLNDNMKDPTKKQELTYIVFGHWLYHNGSAENISRAYKNLEELSNAFYFATKMTVSTYTSKVLHIKVESNHRGMTTVGNFLLFDKDLDDKTPNLIYSAKDTSKRCFNEIWNEVEELNIQRKLDYEKYIGNFGVRIYLDDLEELESKNDNFSKFLVNVLDRVAGLEIERCRNIIGYDAVRRFKQAFLITLNGVFYDYGINKNSFEFISEESLEQAIVDMYFTDWFRHDKVEYTK